MGNHDHFTNRFKETNTIGTSKLLDYDDEKRPKKESKLG
ncbi:unnamed protein product, partial [marine sediment metagenome]